MMKTVFNKPALGIIVAAAIAAGSCAVTGRREAPLPCADENPFPTPLGASGTGCEISGKVRIELPRYRFRGNCRVLYAADGRLRVDFEHSSLFGAVEKHFTILAGERLVIHDNGDGSYLAGDSAIAAVEEELGERIMADDIAYALLLASPRRAEIENCALERRRGGLSMRGIWRGREIEVRCDDRGAPRRFEQRFLASGQSYLLEYEGTLPVGDSHYPRRIRFSREGGRERISIELVDIKLVAPDSLEFFVW